MPLRCPLFRRACTVTLSLGLLLAPDSRAVPGDLDHDFAGFGNGGRQNVGFTVNAMTIDPQGRLVLAGTQGGAFHVQRRSGWRFQNVENASTIIDGGQQSAVARAVAIAPDGKIVLAGTIVHGNGSRDFAVARFHDNLTIDDTFAGDGTQNSDFDDHNDDAYAVAVQDDLKIVVAGSAVIEGTIYTDADWGVERFNENGTLDGGFNGNGKWTYDSESFDNAARAVAIDGNGQIVVTGEVYTGNLGGDYDFRIIRLNPNGTYDALFSHPIIGFGDEEDGPRAMALDPSNGTIVVAGGDFYEPNQIKVARVLSTGGPDNSFDGDGKLTAPIDGLATAHAVVVQPDHKTVVAGRALFVDDPDQFVLMRLNPDGTSDSTFGLNGKVFTQFGAIDTGVLGIGMRFDGSFLAAGNGQIGAYRTDGSLDAGGTLAIRFDPAQTAAEATGLDVDDDGKLVVGGMVFLDSTYDIAAARFAADYSTGFDSQFGTGFPQTGRTLYGSAGTLEVAATAVQPNGKIALVGRNFFDNYNLLVARLNADGTPDPACSGVGYNTVDYGVGDDMAADLVVVGEKILAAGTVRGPTSADFGLVRFSNTCVIDDAGGPFANPYKFRVDLGGEEVLGAMTLQGARIILAGTSNGHAVVAGVKQNGATGNVGLDSGFGTGGKTVLSLGTSETVTGVATQSDGKLIVSGWLTHGAGSDFFAARLTAGGLLDDDFGNGGVAYATFNAIDIAKAMTVGDDDKIAMAGCTVAAGKEIFAVAQFNADGSPDAGFSLDGEATLRMGPSGEECANAVTYYGSDRLVVGGYTSVFGVREMVLAAFESGLPVLGTCGDPNEGGITATDALIVLRAAVGTADCELCICDVDDSGAITASDSLRVLRRAVGQVIALVCPAC